LKLPSKKILTLAASCIALVAILSAYRVALAMRQSRGTGSSISVATDASSANSKLQGALQDADEAQASSTNPFAPSPNDTMTDTLSKGIFSAYAQTQVADDDGTDEPDTDTAINQALSSVDTSTLPKPRYSLNDITISSSIGAGDLRNYANQFATIQNTGFQLIANNPGKYNNDLNAIGTVYYSIGEQLIKMSVPSPLVEEHLEITNDFIFSADNFKLITQQDSDPMKALLALRHYKDANVAEDAAYTEIAYYLRSNGILFDQSEPGYMWVQIASSSDAAALNPTPYNSTQSDDSADSSSLSDPTGN
jgi:hypothetical protein